MNRQITIILIFTVFLLESCIPLNTCNKVKKYIVFDKKNMTLPKYLCGIENKFTPTIEEINVAENIICTNKLSYSNRLYDPNLSKYYRQYFGLINSNNDKIIVINLLHKKLFKDKKGDENIYFQSEFSQGFGENYEKYARTILVNIDKKKWFFPCEF